jgi:hypothetical protein
VFRGRVDTQRTNTFRVSLAKLKATSSHRQKSSPFTLVSQIDIPITFFFYVLLLREKFTFLKSAVSRVILKEIRSRHVTHRTDWRPRDAKIGSPPPGAICDYWHARNSENCLLLEKWNPQRIFVFCKFISFLTHWDYPRPGDCEGVI